MNKEHGIETEKANWRLLSHAVREIFSELHKICQYAIGGDPSIQIWYSIQAWQLQERIKGNQFMNDPIVEAVYNQHIKDSAVSKIIHDKDMDNLKSEISEFKDIVKQLRKDVQSVKLARGKKE